jgi:hypothetical protein
MVSAKNKFHKLCDHIFSEIFSRKVFEMDNTMVKTPENATKSVNHSTNPITI